MKNKGHTIIELCIVIFLISIGITFSYYSYDKAINLVESKNIKNKIISIIENEKKYIEFNFKNNNIISSKNYLKLNKRFIYKTNSKFKNFKRYYHNDNFDKGFSIYICDKSGKVLEKIIYNTANNLKIPLLNTYE